MYWLRVWTVVLAWVRCDSRATVGACIRRTRGVDRNHLFDLLGVNDVWDLALSKLILFDYSC